ncbi:PAS domain S-box protein [Sulfurimonas sp. C5]|uniref:PAS domain S-box protein n=1 Tax=Sulfurimonas sp. C5 TaxID=3036947 RepID=UPI0024560B45|nr:PAS domain S-box protein [Sulfurimonas sp. C5]MDH4943695.1 PAS domain S-box protein [Sulfurimonas sp. C5]
MEVKNIKQIEQALQEWVSALDVLDDAIFIHDQEYRILRCNSAYQRLASLPFKQIIGQPYFKVFPKSKEPLPHCSVSIDKNCTEENENDILVDGVLYRSRSYIIRDKEGIYHYSIQILQDITKEQADEERLKQNEKFIKAVLDNLPIGIAVNTIEPEVKFNYMNDNFPKLYRTTREALKNPDDFWKAAYEDINFRKKIKKQVIDDYESGDPLRMHWNEVPLTRKGKETSYISAQNIPLPDMNSIISMVWDVTERRNMEELLLNEKRFSDKLIESIPDIFFVLNGEGKFERWNKKIETLFGLTSEELKDRNALSLIYEDDRPEIAKKIEETLALGYTTVDTRVMAKEGLCYYKFTSKRITTPNGTGIIGIGLDMTKRKNMELQLKRERDFSDRLIETAPVIVLLLDKTGHIVRYNRYMEQLSGYPLEEVAGKEWFSLVLPEATREKTREIFLEAINDLDSKGNIDSILTRWGDELHIEWYSKTIKDAEGKTEGLLAIGVDVTEQQKVQERLELFHTLLENSTDAVEIIEPGTLKLLDVNDTLCRELGYSRKELLEMTIYDIDPTVTPDMVKTIKEKIDTEGNVIFESLNKRRDGTIYPVEVSLSLNKLEHPYLLAIVRDITERKEAEEHLKESEEKFRTMTASAQDAILMIDSQGNISYWNEAAERVLGYSADEAMGTNLHKLITPERFMDAHLKGFKEFQRTGQGAAVGKTVELAAIKKDGTEFPIELSLSSILHKDGWGAIGIMRDISERKASEAALNRANRALKTLSAGNLALVHATSEEELLKEVTRVIVERGGYSLAVVDYADDGPEKNLTPVAWHGFSGEEYWLNDLCWKDTGKGVLPAGAAIREGVTQIFRDIKDPLTCPNWRDAAIERGYVSHISLPLFDGKKPFGVLSIYSSQEESFDEEEIHLLEELANDLAYGIGNQRTRDVNKKHEAILRESLEQTILAISATVESRDPYTAGHQKRVAELATAIAKEMGLGQEEIEGIRFAAIIHDLGKIHIPAEILAKPGRLTDIEFMLIKTHPQAGYDIIKDVNFPWPIAQIILQHHEHVDGSGYPQGLKGDEILLGAKIITVADVIEAISSHRPYRSALGIQVALDEVTKGRGTRYDSVVVDTCMKLFKEKKFTFNTDSSMLAI